MAESMKRCGRIKERGRVNVSIHLMPPTHLPVCSMHPPIACICTVTSIHPPVVVHRHPIMIIALFITVARGLVVWWINRRRADQLSN